MFVRFLFFFLFFWPCSAKQLREWREKYEVADAERQRLQQSLVQAIDGERRRALETALGAVFFSPSARSGSREQARLAAEALNSQESRRWQLETEVYVEFLLRRRLLLLAFAAPHHRRSQTRAQGRTRFA